MEKRTYIQPEMKAEELYADASVMLLSSNTNLEPTTHQAPKRVVTPTNPVAAADTVQVF